MADAVATPSRIVTVSPLLHAGPGRAGRRDGERLHARAQGRRRRRPGLSAVGDDVGDLGELGVAEAAGGERRRADAHARGDHRRARVERHGVAVHRDADLVQAVLGLLAVDRRVAQVDEHEVHVGAAGEHVDAGRRRVVGGEALGEDLRAADGALLAVLELAARRRA